MRLMEKQILLANAHFTSSITASSSKSYSFPSTLTFLLSLALTIYFNSHAVGFTVSVDCVRGFNFSAKSGEIGERGDEFEYLWFTRVTIHKGIAQREEIRNMDANSLISNKRQKQHEREGSTMINDLPDELLQKIICKLLIRETVRTTVLSKRWKNKWTEIPEVKLVQDAHGKREQFLEFVEKLLGVFNTLCLKKLCLACDVCKDTPQVNRWLSSFIHPNIEELKLDFERVEEQLVFPNHLFYNKSLTHFHLSMPHVINLPSLISFSILSTLTLKHVIFPDTSKTQQLFSSCPCLENLTLIDCNWMNVRAVSILNPSLQTLIIREWRDDDDDENDAVGQNVQTYCQIAITGCNLKTFSYDGDLINDYILYSTASVTDGAVEVHPPPNNTLNAGKFALKLLKALSNVEKLSISDFTVEALCCASSLITDIPLFNNLVELSVVSAAPVNLACDALMTIFRNSPILETVEFITGISMPKNDLNNIGPLPTCFETHLTTIRIYGFTGTEEEMLAIKFLLQSTPHLDALFVHINPRNFDSTAGSKMLNRLFKQIIQFPSASEDRGIYFE
ncbi:F-box protein, partial [Mucuna pruriens]